MSIPPLRSGQFHGSGDEPVPAAAGAGDPLQRRSGKRQLLLRCTHLGHYLVFDFFNFAYLILGLDVRAAGVGVARPIPIRVTRVGYDVQFFAMKKIVYMSVVLSSAGAEDEKICRE
jgi:hypothetical protein